MVVLALVTGCGVEGSSPAATSSIPDVTTSSLPEVTTSNPSEPSDTMAIARRVAEFETYEFFLSITADGRSGEMTGSWDGASEASHSVIEAEPDRGVEAVEVIRVGDRAFLKGNAAAHFGGVHPDAWYEVDPDAFGADETTEQPMHLLLDALAAAGEPDEVATGTWRVEPAKLGAAMGASGQPHWIDGPARVTVLEGDDKGVRFQIEILGNESIWDTALVDIRSAPVSIEIPEDVLDLGDDQSVDPSTRIRPDEDGVLFTVTKYLAPDEFRISVEHNGRVVMVSDRSVHATSEDYVTLTLSDEDVAHLVALVEDSGLLGHTEANRQFGEFDGVPGYAISYGGGFVLGLHGPPEAPGLDATEIKARRQFHQLFSELSDWSWMKEQALNGPEPFVPESLVVTFSRTTSPENTDWPFNVSPTELANGGEDRFCLTDDDAAELWMALGDLTVFGMVVSVDNGRWSLDISPGSPGYQLYGETCTSGREP